MTHREGLFGITFWGANMVSFVTCMCSHLAANPQGSCQAVARIIVAMVLILGCTLIILSFVARVIYLLALAWGSGSSWLIIAPTLCTKVSLGVMRTVWYASEKYEISNSNFLAVLSFVVSSTVSLSIRRVFLSTFGQDLLSIFLMTLALAITEFLTRIVASLFLVVTTARSMQRATINRETLGSILATHQGVQTRLNSYRDYLYIDHFSEIFVSVTIFTQYVSQPVWSQYLVWLPISDWNDRYGHAVATLLFHLCLEGILNYWVMRWYAYTLNMDFSLRSLRRFSFYTWVAIGGYMMTQSVSFWLKCGTCAHPYECLLFVECLRTGDVAILSPRYKEPVNACTTHFEYDSNVAAQVRNLSRVDEGLLGCNRSDVDCHYGYGY